MLSDTEDCAKMSAEEFFGSWLALDEERNAIHQKVATQTVAWYRQAKTQSSRRNSCSETIESE